MIGDAVFTAINYGTIGVSVFYTKLLPDKERSRCVTPLIPCVILILHADSSFASAEHWTRVHFVCEEWEVSSTGENWKGESANIERAVIMLQMWGLKDRA